MHTQWVLPQQKQTAVWISASIQWKYGWLYYPHAHYDRLQLIRKWDGVKAKEISRYYPHVKHSIGIQLQTDYSIFIWQKFFKDFIHISIDYIYECVCQHPHTHKMIAAYIFDTDFSTSVSTCVK